jgi:hypothetical protein
LAVEVVVAEVAAGEDNIRFISIRRAERCKATAPFRHSRRSLRRDYDLSEF